MYGPGHISYFDYLVLAIILISIIQAAITGFVRELLSLGALIAAFIIASIFGNRLTPYIIGAVPIDRVASSLSYLAVFMGASLILGILVKIISYFIGKAVGGGLNHGLGAFFGLIRATIILVVPFYYATMYVKDDMFGSWLTHSISYPYLRSGAKFAKAVMPASMQPDVKEPVITKKSLQSLEHSVAPLKDSFENGKPIDLSKPIPLMPE